VDEPAGGEAPQEAVLIWKKVAFIHRRSRVFLVFNKGVLRVPGLQFSISLVISAGYRKSTVTNSARKVTNSGSCSLYVVVRFFVISGTWIELSQATKHTRK
jgi:hypothetical protein